jgi:Ca2+:H+ antiporter
MIGIDHMSLSFSAFETLILLAGVLVVNYVVSDGKSNWLIGALLVASYLIVSVSAYYIP